MLEEYNKSINLLKIQKDNIINNIQNKNNIDNTYIKEATNAMIDIDNKLNIYYHLIEDEKKIIDNNIVTNKEKINKSPKKKTKQNL